MTYRLSFRRTLPALTLLAAFAVLPASAQAQRAPDSDRVERRVEAMQEALSLSAEQATQIRAIFQARAAERPERGARPERGQRGGDRQAMRAQRAERRAETERQIETVLTPAQAESYRAWRDAQRSERGDRRGNGS